MYLITCLDQAAIARLDALENDQNDGGTFAADENDEEVVLDSEGEEELGGKKKRGRKSGGGQRKKLRGGARGPKSFSRLLEDFVIERSQSGDTGPSYLTAAAGPPRTGAPRKFCSICGMESQYTCSRCGQKYCKTKCYKTHCETRCLKFTL